METTPDPASAERHRKQKRTLLVLAVFLLIGGVVVLFALQRMPLPMRMLVGFSDIIAGLVLLVVLRQNR